MNIKIKVRYSCPACEKTFDNKTDAERHAEMPVDENLPTGLVIKNDNIINEHTKIIVITDPGKRADKRDHGQLQPHEDLCYINASINSAYVRRGLKKGTFKILTEKEFEDFKTDYSSRKRMLSPDKLIRTTPELERISN